MLDALHPFRVPGRMTRRLLAVVLVSQAPVLFFAAIAVRALAHTVDPSRAGTYLWIGTGLAVLALVASGLLRRPGGVALGWVVQLATLASAIVVRPMLLVALVFGGLWVVALVKGRQMDDLTDRYVAAQAGPPAAGDAGPTA